MNTITRTVVCTVLSFFGIFIMSWSIAHRRDLPKVVPLWTKEKVIEKVKWQTEYVNINTDGKRFVTLKHVSVSHAWRFVSGCIPSGEYQFESDDRNITTAYFCKQPPLILTQGSLVDISYYDDNGNCAILVKAHVIKEGKGPKTNKKGDCP